jgi:hypothetical protein
MRVWRWAWLLLTVGAVAVGFSATAMAAPPAAKQFVFTGGEQSYQVPPEVTMLGVETIGGSGNGGGSGADIGAALPVAPGEALFAEVGGDATGTAAVFGGGGAAGAGDAAGGAGGGASDVRTCSIHAGSCPGGGTSSASRLVVAGGGGGVGGEENSMYLFGETCGGDENGGPAFGSSTPVAVAGGTVILGGADDVDAPAQPAGGGGATGPGAGGYTGPCSGGVGPHNFADAGAGQSGAGPDGGAGGASAATPTPGGGGGGGGGYFGGGGGSSGQADVGSSASDGSGGAGGSSFYTSRATGEIFYQEAGTQSPSVILTPLIEIGSPAGGAAFRQGQSVEASYSCLDTCSGTVPSGSPIDTTTAGTHSFEVTDRYESHGPAVSTVTYTVVAAPQLKASHPALSGVGKGRAKLSFILHASALKSITLGLPSGLRFSTSTKTLAKRLAVKSLSGHRLKFAAKLNHGKLTITLGSAQPGIQLAIAPPGISVSKALASKVKHHEIKTLGVTVNATATTGASTRLVLKLRAT